MVSICSKVPNNCIVIKSAKTHKIYNMCGNRYYRLKAVLNRCVLCEHFKLWIYWLCLICLI